MIKILPRRETKSQNVIKTEQINTGDMSVIWKDYFKRSAQPNPICLGFFSHKEEKDSK